MLSNPPPKAQDNPDNLGKISMLLNDLITLIFFLRYRDRLELWRWI